MVKSVGGDPRIVYGTNIEYNFYKFKKLIYIFFRWPGYLVFPSQIYQEVHLIKLRESFHSHALVFYFDACAHGVSYDFVPFDCVDSWTTENNAKYLKQSRKKEAAKLKEDYNSALLFFETLNKKKR